MKALCLYNSFVSGSTAWWKCFCDDLLQSHVGAVLPECCRRNSHSSLGNSKAAVEEDRLRKDTSARVFKLQLQQSAVNI
ncbi:hypothetical protein LENED_004627 [Lentinula edodes]|uniref:Uncharacterized protein n=1 Tax=Lentinula edodes TaxID=5353 RepID=A0A1Q3E6U8_LENED|nr:hypothetical protein LENED_004627 [Lentinula edodes]